MEDFTTKVTNIKKPKYKEIVMLIFACAILISSFVFKGLPFDPKYTEDLQVYNPSVYLATGFVVMGHLLLHVLMFFICWIVGLIISLKLVFRRKLIPRWMHIVSLTLMFLYSILIIDVTLRFLRLSFLF